MACNRPLTGIAITLATIVALTSCGGGQPGTDATSSSAATASSNPPASSTTTSTSPESTATSLSKDLIPRYYRLADEAIQSPSTANAEGFKEVATSSALIDLQNLLAASREQGLHQIGATTLISVKNPRVDLVADVPKNQIPTVQWDVCYDVSGLNVVDKDGKSIVPAGRALRALVLVGVSNYQYPAKDGWRVSFTSIQEGKKC